MSWLSDLIDKAKLALGPSPAPATAANPGGGAAVQECPLKKLQIVRFGFTDKSKSALLFGGTRNQYVNLAWPRKHPVDSALVHNQLGRLPPVAVQVSPPCRATVRVHLYRESISGEFPAASSTDSLREQKLDTLMHDALDAVHETNEQGELLLEPGLKLSVAAGYKYHVMASLVGQAASKSANAVQVRRRIYLLPINRYAKGWAAANAAIDALTTYFEKLAIEVKKLPSITDAEFGVTERDTLSPDLPTLGQEALDSTDQLKSLAPHCIAIMVGEFLSTATKEEAFEIELDKPKGGSFPSQVKIPLVKGDVRYRVLPLKDNSQVLKAEVSAGWFSSEDLRPQDLVGTDKFSRTITVDLTQALKTLGDKDTITVTLKLKVVRGWAVGWAYTESPVIFLNMRDPATDGILTSTEAQALVVHEVGHKLHLTSTGTGSQPDKQPHHYPTFESNGVRHQGPHCSKGVPAGTDLWTSDANDAASCTMFGALTGKTQYCSECLTTLRKVDLGDGF